MLSLILTVAMMHTTQPAEKSVASIQPCVWPNTCAIQSVAKVQPCVWPNTCVEPVAQYQTCQWPNKCVSRG